MADQGVDQPVILGAGLDSVAYRSELAHRMRVFEVDEPDAYGWKQKLLVETATTAPASVRFVALDLEQEPAHSLPARLARAGFDLGRPALVNRLGVTMYLILDAIEQVLSALAGFAPGTELVIEHLLPAEHRDEVGQPYAELVMTAAAEQGEPWRTFLSSNTSTPSCAHGLQPVEHIRQRDAIDPAHWDRTDALRPFDLSVPTRATVPARA
nr:SAM-dependent methyltransferase [Nocardia bhagyanarayanae]